MTSATRECANNLQAISDYLIEWHRARVGDSSLTQTAEQTEVGSIVGTAPYMSPEQAEGKSLDQRSDLFSFGVVLYEMVTGRRAFQGDSQMAILACVLREQPPPFRTYVSGAPAGLQKIVTRCLQKEPGRRFHHAAALKSELEGLISSSPSS